MIKTTEPTFWIQKASQLRVIADPMRTALYEAMCLLAPCGATELAAHLGRSPESLHYHLRKLLGIGLIRIAEQQSTGGRRRLIYDLVARQLRLAPEASMKKSFREARVAASSTMLRRTERGMHKAIRANANPTPAQESRTVRMEQQTVSLSSRDLARLNQLIDAIHKLCHDGDNPNAEHRVALTLALYPEPPVEGK